MKIEVKKIHDDPLAGWIMVDMKKPEIVTRGMMHTTEKAFMPVVVYDKNGDFKEVVERVARPRKSFGAWAVWAVKYKNKTYESMGDDIYGYLTIVEGD